MSDICKSDGVATLVVGVDGSAEVAAALGWAVAEARLRKAPLRVAHGSHHCFHYAPCPAVV